MQRDHFVDVLSQYAAVSKEIDQAHRQQERDAASLFSELAAKADNLINYQTEVFSTKMRRLETWYRKEVNERNTEMSAYRTKTDNKLNK